MNPSEPPALPIVETITISSVVMTVRERKKNAKKKRAAMVGPSSMTPNESVRYEFTPHSNTDKRKPERIARRVGRLATDAFGTGDGGVCSPSGEMLIRREYAQFWLRAVGRGDADAFARVGAGDALGLDLDRFDDADGSSRAARSARVEDRRHGRTDPPHPREGRRPQGHRARGDRRQGALP